MRRSKFAEAEMQAIVRAAESGRPVRELCRIHGIAPATFFRWKRRYGHRPDLAGRVRSLEAENAWFRTVVARQDRELSALRAVLAGNYKRRPTSAPRRTT